MPGGAEDLFAAVDDGATPLDPDAAAHPLAWRCGGAVPRRLRLQGPRQGRCGRGPDRPGVYGAIWRLHLGGDGDAVAPVATPSRRRR